MAIGGVGGGIGSGLGGLLLILWGMTSNFLYIGLFVTLIAAIFLSTQFLDNKYLKLDLMNSQ